MRDAYREALYVDRNDHQDNDHIHYTYDNQPGLCVLQDRTAPAEAESTTELELIQTECAG